MSRGTLDHFARGLRGYGKEPQPDMPVVRECFEAVFGGDPALQGMSMEGTCRD